MPTVSGRNNYEWLQLSKRLKKELPSICHICGYEIDTTISGRHPRGWTLDHVIPLCDRPDLAMDESNLRPAHKSCNSSRGTGHPKAINVSREW